MPPVTRRRTAQDDGDDGMSDSTLPLANTRSTLNTTTAASRPFGSHITTTHHTILQPGQQGRVHPTAGSRGRSPQAQPLTSSRSAALRTSTSAGGVLEDCASHSIGMAAAVVHRLGVSGSTQLSTRMDTAQRFWRNSYHFRIHRCGSAARCSSSDYEFVFLLQSRGAEFGSAMRPLLWNAAVNHRTIHSNLRHGWLHLNALRRSC